MFIRSHNVTHCVDCRGVLRNVASADVLSGADDHKSDPAAPCLSRKHQVWDIDLKLV